MTTIKSEYDLDVWNANPTAEVPNVWDWFYDQFFWQHLANDRYHSAFGLRKRMMTFLKVSENITEEEAYAKVDKATHDWSEANRVEVPNKTLLRGENRDWRTYLAKLKMTEIDRKDTRKRHQM